MSESKIIIKNKIIGGEKALICVPLISQNSISLNKDLKLALSLKTDIVEWRFDYFIHNKNLNYIINTLILLKKNLNNTPLIFTIRDISEGGRFYIDKNEKLKIIEILLKTKTIDMIDVEINQGIQFINTVKIMLYKYTTKLILSYHNFNFTPSSNDIILKINEAVKFGANIPKVAYKANSIDDIKSLLEASTEIKKINKNPLINISMGELGKITRIYAKQFNSDITYASLINTNSATGQIEISELKKLLSIFS